MQSILYENDNIPEQLVETYEPVNPQKNEISRAVSNYLYGNEKNDTNMSKYTQENKGK